MDRTFLIQIQQHRVKFGELDSSLTLFFLSGHEASGLWSGSASISTVKQIAMKQELYHYILNHKIKKYTISVKDYGNME